MRQVQRRWQDWEVEFIRRFYGESTYSHLGWCLDRTWTSVRNKANSLGLTGNANLGKRYSTDLEFFRTPNVLNSYWAGFIAADGCVSGNRLSIGLNLKDRAHLEKFVFDCGFTGPVSPPYANGSVQVSISCKRYVEDLRKNFNVVERKSLTLMPPGLLNRKCSMAFVCGLIDGDGTVGLKEGGYLLICCVGTKPVLEWVRGWFDCVSSCRRGRQRVRPRPGGRTFVYRVSGAKAMDVWRVFSGLEIPCLERKWKVAKDARRTWRKVPA